MTNQDAVEQMLAAQFTIPPTRTWKVARFLPSGEREVVMVSAHRVVVHEPNAIEFVDVEVIDGVPGVVSKRIMFNIEDVEAVPQAANNSKIIH